MDSLQSVLSSLTAPRIVPYPLTLVLATVLGLHGKRNGSLSRSGAIAAGLLGYLTLANPLRVFGVCLLTFYFAGSRATKVKAAHKATLEDDESSPSPDAPISPATLRKPGGHRSALQVCCNALLGTLCAVLWRAIYSGEFADGREWAAGGRLWLAQVPRGERWCVVDERWGWSRALVLGAVAFWGACAGDTFASELGILSSTPPILITTLRPVPRGTNGGVSPWGLFMSLLGGLLIGLVAAVDLALEVPECANLRVGPWGLSWGWLVVGVGAWSGFVGSFIDSLLGALVQETLFSKTRQKIVHSREGKDKDEAIERIAGRPILSNNGVNLVSSAVTALAVVWWARPLDA